MTAPKRNRVVQSMNQTAKERNYVFAQKMKIQKINKDNERKRKMKLEENKNKEVETIIQNTKT